MISNKPRSVLKTITAVRKRGLQMRRCLFFWLLGKKEDRNERLSFQVGSSPASEYGKVISVQPYLNQLTE